MEERGALLPSFFRSCSSSRADRKCPSYSEEAIEGGTFIGCSVSSVFCSLPSCLPRWGACKHLGWSSVRVRPSSRCRSGRRKEGRKGASLCFAFAPSLPCLCLSPTYFILTLSLSVSTLRSFPPTDSLFAIELAKKKINAAASTADRASTFYSGGHWLPLPPSFLPPFRLSSLCFIYRPG